nr:carboxypeptidase-like regulatory domain-containing protein [Allomuricauda sp.]
MKTKIIFLTLFLSSVFPLFAQQGIISGTLLDKEGVPIPGVNITIKGSNEGAQTDFDGNYSISCSVGDFLVFTYIGFSTKEVKVTADMFQHGLNTKIIRKEPVQQVLSEDYINFLKQQKGPQFDIPDIATSYKKFTSKYRYRYFNASKIKDIEISKDAIKVKNYTDDLYFEIGLQQKTSLQFVQQSNLPEIQTQFAQGRPEDGNLAWFGAETNEAFSFGPRISNLEFDGQAYPFDSNGALVALGSGNGQAANAYRSQLFKNSWNHSTALNLNIHTEQQQLNFSYTNSAFKDLFNKSGSKTNYFDLGYINQGDRLQWDASVQWSKSKTENANINGLYNQIHLAQLITPPTFSNSQGPMLIDGSQRSFSPQNYNNPYWLLEHNQNTFDHSFLKAILQNSFDIAGNLKIATGLTYTKQEENIQANLPLGTNGFPNGFRSNKQFGTEEFTAALAANYWHLYLTDDIHFSPHSSFRYHYSDLNYHLTEASLFQELNNITSRPVKSTLELENRMLFEGYFGFDLRLTLQNNSFSSSVQGSKWFLPSAKLYLQLGNRIFDHSDFLHSISISGGYSKNVVDFPLYYNNFSHNSLQLEVENHQSYTTNNDLFISTNLEFEEAEQFDVEAKISFFNNKLSLGANYYNALNKNSIFPVFEGNWELRNMATIRNQGLEASIDFDVYRHSNSNFGLDTRISFSRNTPMVQSIADIGLERIPVAGFSSISKNLIKGQAPGTIVGSAFLRNQEGQVVIGPDGFPLVDSQPQILGNPIPYFNLGWSTTLHLHQFTMNFLWDYQKGGDIWNGTQNTLNYFGTSQESVQLRGISDFIFQGVDAQGNINALPVAFAPTTSNIQQNRWVRYGFEGVAEEAIADGSYLNLKSISLKYTIKKDDKDALFKEVVFGLFAKNVWTWTKTRGANPYSALFGNSTASGLHFFNLPLASEAGININIKI